MKPTLTLLALIFILSFCSTKKEQSQTSDVQESSPMQNQLTQEEMDQGWKLLFDGKTSIGWRGYGKENFPAAWQIKDESLFMTGNESRTDAQKEDGGDIIFDQAFANFHLKIEWKIAEGGNSGIFYLGQEREDGPVYITAPEMQVLDNERHPDANQGKDGNRKAGSLYDLIPANPQNANPAMQWNSAEVIKQGNKIQHLQNGVVVVSYEFGTDEWRELVAGSKFPRLNENWVDIADSGLIALQDHGNDVWFRNIKIREL